MVTNIDNSDPGAESSSVANEGERVDTQMRGQKRQAEDAMADFPPPPPPPVPPKNNPFYERFVEDHLDMYKNRRQQGAAVAPLSISNTRKDGEKGTSRWSSALPTLASPDGVPVIPRTTPICCRDLPTEEFPEKKDREAYFLASPRDVDYLSARQCYLRSRMLEVFVAKEDDTTIKSRARKASFVGQVGIRCVYCVPQLEAKERADRAITYPSSVSRFHQTGKSIRFCVSFFARKLHFSCALIRIRIIKLYKSTT